MCKHEWKVLDKTVLPSAWEQLKARMSVDKGHIGLFRKKVVVILVCKKCGKLNKTVETNP